MIFSRVNDLKNAMSGIIRIAKDGGVSVVDVPRLKGELIDRLAYSAALSPQKEIKDLCQYLIRASAPQAGVFISSIQGLYEAMGREECGGFTVPAINIRGLTYDVARTVLHAAQASQVGAVLFEIARSEMIYTFQMPADYSASVIAAAIREGLVGPLFIQGDHFQINAKKYASDPQGQIDSLRQLVLDAIAAGFYNIDIDASTIVDLSQPTVREQQRRNYEVVAEMLEEIRRAEPPGITVSVGGEIGEVGGKNSTVEELEAFMDGLLSAHKKRGPGPAISKISIQTGTTHGGVPLPDGTIAKVNLDFDTLEKLSRVAREKYRMAGAVQHGASTLPREAFDRFPGTRTAEVHLATQFQNLTYDKLPQELRAEIYQYLLKEFASERKTSDSEEQFIYKTRKKGFGPFKEKLWTMPPELKQPIMETLEQEFSFIFNKLNMANTAAIVKKHIRTPEPPLNLPTAINLLV